MKQDVDLREEAGRPPTDATFKEIFYDKKCGRYDGNQNFYRWCAGESSNATIETKCIGLHGSNQTCEATARILTEDPLYKDGFGPFEFLQVCRFGPTKEPTKENVTVILEEQEYRDIKRFCFQELYGPPAIMPLWLLLLIVFLTLLAVGTSAVLFWKYWLRQRIYGRARNQKRDISFRSKHTSRASQTLPRRPSE